jgi:hypothetical protein
MNPVIVAAAKFELDPLVHALEQRGHGPEPRLVGIGALNAAKKARGVADACRGRHVIFIGTCGAFVPFTKVMLIRATEVLWSPTGERMGLSYTIKDTAPPISLPEAPAWARGLPPRRVLCSPTISLVSKLPEGLAPEQAVENVELYSCISEIAASCASVAVLLAVTNQVGEDSHTQWRQNFTLAAGQTAEFVVGRLA